MMDRKTAGDEMANDIETGIIARFIGWILRTCMTPSTLCHGIKEFEHITVLKNF